MRFRTVLTVLITTPALAAGLAPVAATPAAATSTAATPGPAFSTYAALGDSFTAGPLVPVTRPDPAGCGRSTGNYPSRLAHRLGVRSFTDISCSGASTRNMRASQDVLLGPNPAQFTALRPETDLVTVSIGGNDYDVFRTVTDTCVAVADDDPSGSPCADHFTSGGVDTIGQLLPAIQHNVRVMLGELKRRVPRATVLLIGYPRLVPPEGTCEDVPFAAGDYPWVDSFERAVNDVLAAAAEQAGASYVDTYRPSLGHDACAPRDRQWINGKRTRPLEAAPYHPTPRGMRAVAAIIAERLGQPIA
ncbi:MAG: SGNH/GDSL hydrolase family protein [Pseudonocardiaceae bacterium]|nr:SGNH/GDSL hydrolase family protein [Pseudonocardiaceae bacterium]